MNVGKLISGVADMPQEAKRKISAIIGAVVADAASLPLEWIYKDENMINIVGDKNPEFWPTSHCPFYSVPTGSLSCYGDEIVTSLVSLARKDAVLDLPDLKQAIQDKFGDPASPYQIALAKRKDKVYPIQGPWINGAVIKSLANISAGVDPSGSDSDENDGLAVSLSTFLIQLSNEEALKSCRALTTNQVATDHLVIQSALVSKYLSQSEDPVSEVIKEYSSMTEIITEIKMVRRDLTEGKTVKEIVSKYGKACSLPGSFQGALAVILSNKNNFVSAVRENILAGGDCNGRSILLGACLGASVGVEGIPMEWIEKVDGIEMIIENAVKIYA